jgi:hypothetical protein
LAKLPPKAPDSIPEDDLDDATTLSTLTGTLGRKRGLDNDDDDNDLDINLLQQRPLFDEELGMRLENVYKKFRTSDVAPEGDDPFKRKIPPLDMTEEMFTTPEQPSKAHLPQTPRQRWRGSRYV